LPAIDRVVQTSLNGSEHQDATMRDKSIRQRLSKRSDGREISRK